MRLLENKYNNKKDKSIIKTFSIFLLGFIIIFSAFSNNVLALDDSKNLGIKAITDPNYVWRVAFTSDGDFNSIKNSISIRELNVDSNGNLSGDLSGDSLGKLVKVKVEPGEDDKTVKIIPPTGGYDLGKSYRITVGKGAKSKNNKNMKRNVLLDFKVEEEIKDIKVDVDVVVSPYIPILKQINIECKLANARKFKIEGNNNLFDINKEVMTLVSGSTAKISLYDNNGKLLGEGTIDVSKSNKSTISISLK